MTSHTATTDKADQADLVQGSEKYLGASEFHGEIVSHCVQRVAERGTATDQFDVTIVVRTDSECAYRPGITAVYPRRRTFTGAARLSRQEEERIHNYFLDARHVQLVIEDKTIRIRLDDGIYPMPALSFEHDEGTIPVSV